MARIDLEITGDASSAAEAAANASRALAALEAATRRSASAAAELAAADAALASARADHASAMAAKIAAASAAEAASTVRDAATSAAARARAAAAAEVAADSTAAAAARSAAALDLAALRAARASLATAKASGDAGRIAAAESDVASARMAASASSTASSVASSTLQATRARTDAAISASAAARAIAAADAEVAASALRAAHTASDAASARLRIAEQAQSAAAARASDALRAQSSADAAHAAAAAQSNAAAIRAADTAAARAAQNAVDTARAQAAAEAAARASAAAAAMSSSERIAAAAAAHAAAQSAAAAVVEARSKSMSAARLLDAARAAEAAASMGSSSERIAAAVARESAEREHAAARAQLAIRMTESAQAQAASSAAAALARQSAASGSAAMTAGQLANAQRMIPTQMTDIATSMASGMPPWMVLIQQGGQLKDTFGGVVPAAKGVAQYIGGLVTPLNLAIVAVTAVAAATYYAATSHANLANTLSTSGNAIGMTEGQLLSLAQSVASASDSTRTGVESVIGQMVSAGNISADVLGKVSEAAILLERAGGASIDSTVKHLSEIGKDPLAAAQRLQEQFGFLSTATYEQAKASVDAGDKAGAAKIVQEAWADSAKRAHDEMIQRQGLLQRALASTMSAARSMWNALAGAGAPGNERQKELAELRKKSQESTADMTAGEWDRLAAIEAEISAEAVRAKSQQDDIARQKAKAEWDKKQGDQYTKYLPSAERKKKLDEEINRIEREGAAAGAERIEIEARIAKAKEDSAKIEKPLEPKKAKKETGMASVMQQYETEISQQKAAFSIQQADAGTFHEFQKSQEIAFWKSKLDLVKAGSTEEAQIREKIADLSISQGKSKFEAEIEGYKAEVQAAGQNGERKLEITRQIQAAIVKAYGVGSKEAIQAESEVAKAAKFYADQQERIKEERLLREENAAIAAADSEFERKKQLASQETKSPSMDFTGDNQRQKEIAAEIEHSNTIASIMLARAQRSAQIMLEDPAHDPVAYEKKLTEIQTLEAQHAER